MFQDKDLYICFFCRIYLRDSQSARHTLVCRQCRDHQSIQECIDRPLQIFVWYKQHLIHMVRDYKGLYFLFLVALKIVLRKI